MTERLLGLKRDIGSLKLVPGTGGVFEVSVDGKLLYSKLETGQFPDADALVRQVRQMLS